jgi:3-oxoacyl-[acyl-carrier protein] reductase
MDLGLKGRVYIVTAASRGLGMATAEALVSDGAKVVISSRSPEAIDAAAKTLGEGDAVPVAADNGDPQAADLLVTTAMDRFGRLDGALISVGGPPPGPVSAISDDQWRAAFETVFVGGLRLARAVADRLEPGGSIVFVLSTSVKQPISGLAVSNGLRPGLAMTAKTLADELGPRGIRVNGLLPGRVETERVKELDNMSDDPAATRAAHEESIALRRYGRPEEFGRTAAFLLSPAADYVTGVMLPVDGGLSRAL